ncbi:hypothetical protein LTR56_003265 [Elasticomyces elasticus]|nr:hypothetical protein LTR22_013645 [Elasticomyces elasticus]KAK3656133.1 hypothetical protein LTR56_003265 [Elasticomyces elasticus]KAK4922312.1 hypothetical protein LTR49_010343 [Elasticomyces elasticus]KAK5763766.1 hypothetical protein LTS12_006100 [Elasticomyces elasticus]
MAAEPAYTFTLPSIVDDIKLECRIYHPHGHDENILRRNPNLKGAVVAHPYAPLGGCYDDSAVMAVIGTLLERGYIVATFNFRGAGGSDGKTSWTGRSEVDDYSSVVGFIIHYLQQWRHLFEDASSDVLSPIVSADERNGDVPASARKKPLSLLLGGYSYGSLILARIPSVRTIQQRFEPAVVGTAVAEIVLRARTLAHQTYQAAKDTEELQYASPQELSPTEDTSLSPTKRTIGSPVTMGGEETDSSDRRRSRDSRRSVDIIRKSVDIPRRMKAHMRHSSGSGKQRHHQRSSDEVMAYQISDQVVMGSMPEVEVHYLVISPVVLPFSTALCPPGPPVPQPFGRKIAADAHAGDLFLKHPTLAIFGTKDGFTPVRRLRAWAEKQSPQAVGFEWEPIESAGHFWHEEGVMRALQERIKTWVATLC